jgi:L-lactate dehydrogenase (cytochrome)
MNIRKCHNLMAFRPLAKRRLPRTIFGYLDGGADDEISLRRNTGAFDDYELLPSQLAGIGKVDLSTTLLGQPVEWPVMLSPTSAAKLYHAGGETAVVRAAGQAGMWYGLSTISTSTIEEVAAAASGPVMYQVYVFRDRALTRDFVERCKASKVDALCLTVDTPVAGNRERDLVTGLSGPNFFNWRSVLSYATHPGWVYRAVVKKDVELKNITASDHGDASFDQGVMEYINSQFDPTLSWKDFEWLAAQWDGPLVVKGVQTVEDCRKAADCGATAVMLSNHGGRQLESAPAPVDCIAEVADALRDRLEIICDGGIRRGNHVAKALAEGANACSIGRGYLYALAAGGEAGVARALQLLREELERTMVLLGCDSVAKLGRSHVRRRR